MSSIALECSDKEIGGIVMDFLDKKYGPFTGRGWGLFVNFFANALAIHGAMKYMLSGGNPGEMYLGLATTLLVCLIIAVPSKD